MDYLLADEELIPFYSGKDFVVQDTKKYSESFLSAIDSRIPILCNLVFKNRTPVYSIKSLQAIQYFMQENINVRRRSVDEIESALLKLPEQLRNEKNVDKEVFIEPSYSVAFDVGLFFGEFIKKELKDLSWELESDIDNVLYGHMTLRKNGAELSPFQISYILLKQIRDNRAKEDRLVKLFQNWKSILKS